MLRSTPRRSIGLIFLACALASGGALAGTTTLNGRTFTLPDGFTIEQVAGPPLVDRPVTMDFDEAGRLYVADSSGTSAKSVDQLKEKPHRILRLADSDGDGVFDQRTIFADKMMFPEGTMWCAGSLYVAAPPSIWKLTDTNGDGVADERVEWFDGKTLTGCANDLHGPYLGPDGMIYWCKGAFAQQTYTLPNGREFKTRASHIFRARPDGSNIEPVMTGGMDNPVDVVFMPSGERILSCTFLQNPAGGKRDGLIHAVHGGVYGKVHDVLEGHVRTSPDVLPPLAHLGPSASCGLHRYESTAFGKDPAGVSYTDNLFSCSFNLHKVFRHVLTPEGATFKSKDEEFVVSDHVDFHPTDVIEDADGSLLIVDTGGWYKLCCPTSRLHRPEALGAIYRVRRIGAAKIEDPRGMKIAWETLAPEALALFLEDDRTSVRRRAMERLAARACSLAEGEAPFRAVLSALDRVRESGSARARLNAVWTATRISGRQARAIVRAALTDADETVRIAACHSVALWRDDSAVVALADLLEHPSAPLRRAAAEAIGRCGRPEGVFSLLRASAKSTDPFLDHSLCYALFELVASNEGARRQVFEVAQGSAGPTGRRAAVIATDQAAAWQGTGQWSERDAGRMLGSLLADPRLVATGLWMVSRHPEWAGLVEAPLSQQLSGVNPNDRTNPTPEQRAALVNRYAAMADFPIIQRILAAAAVDEDRWRLSRLTAIRAMGASRLKQTPAAWYPALATCLGHPRDAEVSAAAAEALRDLSQASKAGESVTAAQLAFQESIIEFASKQDAPASVRLNALAALAPTLGKGAHKDAQPLPRPLLDLLFSQGSSEAPATQRLLAAEILAHHKLTAQALMELARRVQSAGPLELPRLLAAFDQTADPAIGLALIEALNRSKSTAALRPDVLKAHLKQFPAELQARAAPLLARLAPDAAKQKAQLEAIAAGLPGGDVGRGQQVFYSAKAACSACHTIGYVGGKVGPDLTRIGAIRQPRDLLESILFPSASFVQSFEPTLIETKEGDTLSGILRRHDSEGLLLITGPDQETRIAADRVKEIRPGLLSIMPAGLDQQLTRAELSDLLTFLGACK
ncbi:MAG: hypothetical protein JWQ03_2338 [Variovorax sp.]|nr:hypothetical protein [Variovorax sp.]